MYRFNDEASLNSLYGNPRYSIPSDLTTLNQVVSSVDQTPPVNPGANFQRATPRGVTFGAPSVTTFDKSQPPGAITPAGPTTPSGRGILRTSPVTTIPAPVPTRRRVVEPAPVTTTAPAPMATTAPAPMATTAPAPMATTPVRRRVVEPAPTPTQSMATASAPVTTSTTPTPVAPVQVPAPANQVPVRRRVVEATPQPVTTTAPTPMATTAPAPMVTSVTVPIRRRVVEPAPSVAPVPVATTAPVTTSVTVPIRRRVVEPVTTTAPAPTTPPSTRPYFGVTPATPATSQQVSTPSVNKPVTIQVTSPKRAQTVANRPLPLIPNIPVSANSALPTVVVNAPRIVLPQASAEIKGPTTPLKHGVVQTASTPKQGTSILDRDLHKILEDLRENIDLLRDTRIGHSEATKGYSLKEIQAFARSLGIPAGTKTKAVLNMEIKRMMVRYGLLSVEEFQKMYPDAKI